MALITSVVFILNTLIDWYVLPRLFGWLSETSMSGESWLMPEQLLSVQTVSMLAVTLALTSVLHIIYRIISLFVKRSKDMEALKAFPGPPPHWLYGNLKDMKIGDTGEQARQRELFATYGSPMRLVPGSLCAIIAGCPTTCAAITATTEPKDPVIYNFITPWIGDGLLVSKGKKWARNRRLLTPAFHFDILKPYVTIFSTSAQVMADKWKMLVKKETSLDMFEHVSLMTLDSLLKCIFGVSKGNVQLEGRRNPYIEAVYALSELATQRFRFFPYHNDWIYYFSPSGYKFRQACKLVHKFSRGVIEDRIRERQTLSADQTQKKKYLDFLDMLLDAKDADGHGLTDTEIQHEADTFMFEGHDTTASGISWCFYNLARYPEYQQKCRDEINEVLGDRTELSWEDMNKLTYVTMCIKESLRIHPPVPNIGRMTTKPLTFPDGRTIPAGTWVGVAIYACHHNADVWENPEVYDPDRFTPENSKGRSPHAFIPFSAGPRNCIGQHFAMHEMRCAVSVIVRNYELRVDESKPVVKIPELILRSKGGLWIKAKPVEQQ